MLSKRKMGREEGKKGVREERALLIGKKLIVSCRHVCTVATIATNLI